MPDTSFDDVFAPLRDILANHEHQLVKVHDAPDNYYLDAAHIQKNKKPLFFGSVRKGKRYVSYHLMPVYIWPDLLDGASDELKKHMQGKSCFNFKKPQPDLFAELRELTDAGMHRYRDEGFV